MNSDKFRFNLQAESGSARAGMLQTPHGRVETPFFMPVGTHAAVKGLTPGMLRECGAQIVLANTYHLAVRPGQDLVADFGGVAAFMGWNGPTLTDSGGYQAFSLAANCKVTEHGFRFRNHIDGSPFELTPESAVAIQQALGADMFMILDVCPPADASRHEVEAAVKRTSAWAARCCAAWTSRQEQALFGIVQGGRFEDLRSMSAEQIRALDFPGNAIGGVSVGESPEEMDRIVAHTAGLLPVDRPRYLMGVGRPQDILRAIGHGMDMFDCVMPTRHARHAQAFTAQGTLNLRNQRFAGDRESIEDGCDCYACRTVSRGYIRHLFNVNEMLGPIYVTIHNLRFYLRMMENAREAIQENRYQTFMRKMIAEMEMGGQMGD